MELNAKQIIKLTRLQQKRTELEMLLADLRMKDEEGSNIGKILRNERKINNVNNNISKLERNLEGKEDISSYLSESSTSIVVAYLNKKRIKHEEALEKYTEKYISLAQAKQEKDSRVSLRRVIRVGKKMERFKRRLQKYDLSLLRLSEGKYPLYNIWGKVKNYFSQMPYYKQKIVVGLLFLTPWIIGFLVFFAIPVLTTISWSFQKLEIVAGGGFASTFIGFNNYRDLFTTAMLGGLTVSEVLTTSVLDILIDLPTILIFSLFIAMLLNTKFKGHEIVKAIFFVPVVYNITAINNTLSGIFGQRFEGVIESGFNLGTKFGLFLQQIGIGSDLIGFLISAVNRIFSIVNMSGIQILMFIAALQSIPKHLYEAAKVEGATSYEMFWKITFPMVSPIIMTALVFTIVNSFATSDIMHFMTVYSQGTTMATNNPGLYSAIAIIYFLANALIIAFAFLLMRRVVFYHDK